MISFFRAPIRNTKPSAQASILQIYKYIISNRASDITRRLRAITDPKEARKYKSEAFDYVTFSGCFSSRCTDELIEHSGFLCFDIDKIESERRLQEIKSLLINDEELHTVLCFRSPSGNGLKWVVEVPDRHWLTQCPSSIVGTQRAVSYRPKVEKSNPNGDCRPLTFCDKREQPSLLELPSGAKITTEGSNVDCSQITINHRLLYERIRQYLLTQYGIATDHTSDIARPCYLCYDPDAYYDPPTFKDNPASKLLTSKPTSLEYQDKRSVLEILAKTNKNNNDYENDIEKIVREIEHRRIDITNNYHDWMLVAMALAGTCGATGEHYFHRISQFHPKYDHSEAHRMYQSCVRNTHGAVGIGTIVYLMHNS